MSREKKRKIDKLTASEKKILDSMIESGATFTHISEYFQEKGHDISRHSIGRYAKDWERIKDKIEDSKRKAKLFFREIRKYPPTDMSEVLEQIIQSQVMDAIINPEFQEKLMEADPVALGNMVSSIQNSAIQREKLKLKFREEYEARKERMEPAVNAKLKDKGIDKETRTVVIDEIDKILMGE